MVENSEIVVCINNIHMENLLTYGKQYTVSKGKYYTIIDDTGLELGYYNKKQLIERFISLKVYRTDIIKDILDET